MDGLRRGRVISWRLGFHSFESGAMGISCVRVVAREQGVSNPDELTARMWPAVSRLYARAFKNEIIQSDACGEVYLK